MFRDERAHALDGSRLLELGERLVSGELEDSENHRSGFQIQYR